MAASDNRRFHYALGASLALHALLLSSFPDLLDGARRAAGIPPQIIARLMAPEPPAAASAPAPRAPDEPVKPAAGKAAKSAPVEKKVAPKPAPTLSAPSRAPAPVPAPAAEAPVAAAPPAPVAAATEAPGIAQPQAAPQAGASAQPSETLSRDQYRLLLIEEAKRHKRYPPQARDNNWQGDVRVGVAVAANGRPTVTLKGSSGYEVLDRQALEMFAVAAQAVPVPAPLRGKEFALEVRAVYGLED